MRCPLILPSLKPEKIPTVHKHLRPCSFLALFEKLHKRLKDKDVYERSGFFRVSVKAKLKDIAHSGYRSYSRPNFIFSKHEIKTLDDLKDDESIIIVKPDKGNGVVILDKNDYNSKMEDILQDTTKFERLMDDPVKLTCSSKTNSRDY